MRLDMNKSYANKRVFHKFALEIDEGEILCVLGASGAGKTTLLNVLAGLTDFEGAIDGKAQRVGYVFQEPRLLSNLTVRQNLAYAGAQPSEIENMLADVELTAYADKRPSALSGGEKQRVSLARAFLSGAPLLLLDEPFTALDLALKVRLMRMFAALWERTKPTTVMVTHDLEEAWALGHRIVVLREGKTVCDIRPKRTVFPATYGAYDEQKQQLIEALVEGRV